MPDLSQPFFIHIAQQPDDLFEYSIYVDALVDIVTQLQTKDRPFVVGVYGPWGSGKTSLMRMIEDKLKKEHEYPVIWFNAWKYDKEDELWAAFLQTILSHLKLSGNLPRRMLNRFVLWWHLIDWQGGFTGILFQLVPSMFKVLVVLIGILLISNPALDLSKLTWFDGILSPEFVDRLQVWLGAVITGLGILSLQVWKLFSTKVNLDLNTFRREDKFKDKVAFLDEFSEELEYLVKLVGRLARVYP